MLVGDLKFTADLVAILRARLLEAKIEARAGGDYEAGRMFAYCEMLALLRQRAIAFGLDLEQINLGDFKLDHLFDPPAP